MTDWIEHTGDTCPVDPETVVEVVLRGDRSLSVPRPPEKRTKKAKDWWWVNNSASSITHYRIITPAKPPEPEMVMRSYPTAAAPGLDGQNILRTTIGAQMPKTHEDYTGPTVGVPPKPEPDLITLRLECLKLAVTADPQGLWDDGVVGLADYFLRYAIDGSVDKADA
jgi:hypothetical protein